MQVQITRETPKNFYPLLAIVIPLLFFTFITRLKAQEKTVTYYSDPASVPPDLPVTLNHLSAWVSFKPEQNIVNGTAEFTVTPNRSEFDSIVFYAPDFQVKSVEINKVPVKFLQSGANLMIDTKTISILNHRPGQPDRGSNLPYPSSVITITYSATPLAGAIYFIGWRPEEKGKRKEIWAHRPHGWLPYMDARITMDLWITFDKKFKVFSNGERMEVITNSDSTMTWHYAMRKNHPYFSTALVIGDYEYKVSTTDRGVPLEFWYYTGLADRVPVTYKYTEKMFAFFEKEFGVNYPYPLYREAPVIDYMYGAMETTTSTVFGDFMLIDPRGWWQRNYVNVNAHELAHQWFGNYIGHFVNRDVWLTESFGTYYAKLFEKSIYGEDYYQNVRNDEMIQTFDAAKKNSFPVGGSQGGVQRIYQKGSLVLDMLRYVLGDKEFQSAVKHYLEKFGFNYAETNDFIRCVYEVTGKPYNWFFDEWILRGGEPEYKVTWSVQDDTLGMRSTRFRIWQTHETNSLIGLFKMPVWLRVHYKDGTSDSTKAWIDSKYNEVEITNRGRKPVSFVLFDPNRQVLKKVVFIRSYSELASQVAGAGNMIDRYDGLVAMHDTAIGIKRELLVNTFRRETFPLIRSEILDQLSSDKTPEITELFREAMLDKDANVRKSALKNLAVVPDLLQSTVERMLQDSSYLNVELALSALCKSFPKNTGYYLAQTENDKGWRGLNIRMKWLEIAIGSNYDETRKNNLRMELIDYTGPKYEFETRINALNLLKTLKFSNDETIRNSRSASSHWNNKLSAVGKEYLKRMTNDESK